MKKELHLLCRSNNEIMDTSNSPFTKDLVDVLIVIIILIFFLSVSLWLNPHKPSKNDYDYE